MIAAMFAGLAAALCGATVLSRAISRDAERRTPPLGRRLRFGHRVLHVIDLPGEDAGALPLVFVHGASGNARDLLLAFDGRLCAHRRLFVDRPGHGWSSRHGRGDASPRVQAEVIARLFEVEGIDRAILIGHSWGGAVVAAFGVDHPEKTAGLVFLAPATHPWPSGVDRLYRLAAMPVIGPLFAVSLVGVLGRLKMAKATAGVFSPDAVPIDYGARIGTALVLRPAEFRANAEDVVDLHANVTALAPRYGEITAPCVVVTGTADAVVWPQIHSEGLARDIVGARLVRLAGVGHMPHHAAPEAVVAEIEGLVARIEAERAAS